MPRSRRVITKRWRRGNRCPVQFGGTTSYEPNKKRNFSEKKNQLEEYEISLEESTSVEDIYLLIDKIKTLLAEIDILENGETHTGLSRIPINDGSMTGNRGVR